MRVKAKITKAKSKDYIKGYCDGIDRVKAIAMDIVNDEINVVVANLRKDIMDGINACERRLDFTVQELSTMFEDVKNEVSDRND